jgi:Cys-tRNA(Pro)/Cys-tRNA(Cys) deacylase
VVGLNERLRKVIAKLEGLDIEYKILELNGKAYTSEDVVRLYGCPIEEICKTVVMKSDKGDFFAVTLGGDKRLDVKKMREIVGCRKMRFLRDDELEELTGFEPGTVCPVTLCDMLPLYLDKSCFRTEKVNFGSGDLQYGIEIKSEDMKKAIKAEVVDVIE